MRRSVLVLALAALWITISMAHTPIIHAAPAHAEAAVNCTTGGPTGGPCFEQARFKGPNYGGRTQIGVLKNITCSNCANGGSCNPNCQPENWLWSGVGDTGSDWPNTNHELTIGYMTWLEGSSIKDFYFTSWATPNTPYSVDALEPVNNGDWTYNTTFMVYWDGSGTQYDFYVDAKVTQDYTDLGSTTGFNPYNIMPGSEVSYIGGLGVSFDEPNTTFGWNGWYNSSRQWHWQTAWYGFYNDHPPFLGGWNVQPGNSTTGGELYTQCDGSDCS